jgi:hypothetical protein
MEKTLTRKSKRVDNTVASRSSTLYYDPNTKKLHREDGPAYILTHVDSDVVYNEEYWRNGVCHRIDGPAIIKYDRTENPVMYSFFVNGERLGFYHLDSNNVYPGLKTI